MDGRDLGRSVSAVDDPPRVQRVIGVAVEVAQPDAGATRR